MIVPKGFFPQQDTGRLIGCMQADQSISFQAMSEKLHADDGHRAAGPGGGDRRRLHRRAAAAAAQINTGSVFVSLKPLAAARRIGGPGDRAAAAEARAGAGRHGSISPPVQDLRVGGRQSNAQYQYTLQSDERRRSSTTGRRSSSRRSSTMPVLADVNSDQQQRGLETDLDDRSRHGGAARRHAAADRQHALRRIRPAAGLDDLQRASISTTS